IPAVTLRRIYLEDPRMVQVARALVLVEERSPGVCRTSRRGLQDLQRNVDSALGIVCAPHLALPADAEPLVEDVAGRQSPSGSGGHSLGHVRSEERRVGKEGGVRGGT